MTMKQKSSISKSYQSVQRALTIYNTARQATAPEVNELRSEASALKECVADLTLENRLLKKSMIGDVG